MARLSDSDMDALCSITGMPLSHRLVATRIAVEEIRERRAADPTPEEQWVLQLIPGLLEEVYRRATIESAVHGTKDPTRANIEICKAFLDRLISAARGQR